MPRSLYRSDPTRTAEAIVKSTDAYWRSDYLAGQWLGQKEKAKETAKSLRDTAKAYEVARRAAVSRFAQPHIKAAIDGDDITEWDIERWLDEQMEKRRKYEDAPQVKHAQRNGELHQRVSEGRRKKGF